MTQDIVEMARELGLEHIREDVLVAFAKLVAADAAAKEREACAKIVEESSLPDAYSEPCLAIIADEIRARGQE